ncbi:hypothetical protein, partial [Vibrio navarrensis]|uniref:hypothetical protein n=1 Tax=Vibrio navarrensis TaxID=29495 RepID=UPI001E413CB8
RAGRAHPVPTSFCWRWMCPALFKAAMSGACEASKKSRFMTKRSICQELRLARRQTCEAGMVPGNNCQFPL